MKRWRQATIGCAMVFILFGLAGCGGDDGGGAGAGGDSLLDELSASDRKHVEKGLEFLGTLLAP